MDYYLSALIQGFCFSGIALGIYLSMKIFNIPDITTDGSFTLGGAVTAVGLSKALPALLLLPTVAIFGAIAGALTGIIHTRLKINSLLAGILVMTALYSVNLTIMGRSNIPLLNFEHIYSLLPFNLDVNLNTLIVLIIIVAALVLALNFVLKSDFGITMRATGNSETMVKAMGVNTNNMKIVGLAMANSLTAVSGYLLVQYQGFADINMGIGIVISGLGAVIIAETFIKWLNVRSTYYGLLFVITGALIFQMVLSIALSLGIDASLLKLVTSLLVLAIVSIPNLINKQSA